MKVKYDFPHAIREIENTWIPLSDGTQLAARIWLPLNAEADPVPAILEYLPYRKNDGTAVRDAIRHPYFAGHGYASIRVDMRGSGDSDGILYDEYLPQEQDDALEVIAWLAAQPWCTGAVGIIGKSWGGFNGLQIAARRPPALKAVITICSTDDRYADDVHYMGGCVLASEMLPWASIMLAYNATPPDPRFVGQRWRQMWLERMEHTPPFVEAWLAHQRRDAFWRHGSVCENFDAITCPVYAVGGWADAYTNAIPRLLAGLSGPRKGLIGPWSHNFPETGVPGPAIGFLQECLRWWDTWLKGIDTGMMNEPILCAWLQDSKPPAAFHAEWPGRWVTEPAWPSPHIQTRLYTLNAGPAATALDGVLSETAAVATRLTLQGRQTTGLHAGNWCPYGLPGDFPVDQRAEDGQSMAFTSAPLASRQEILGFPQVTLTVAVDQPNALLAVRLCDVAPNGASALVSWGLLNLTHRESHAQPAPLVPGQRYTVTVCLNAIGYALPAGHRWRIAISPTYWPHAWPSPHTVTLSLFTGRASQLSLPIRPSHVEAADSPSITHYPLPTSPGFPRFAPAESAPPLPVTTLRTAAYQRLLRHDMLTETAVLQLVADSGRIRFNDNGLEYDNMTSNTFSILEGEPLSAKVHCHRQLEFKRDEWQARIETTSTMTADATTFRVTNMLDAYEGDIRLFTKTWTFTVPRDLA
jgi:putative CocE/NonD family hydrolase